MLKIAVRLLDILDFDMIYYGWGILDFTCKRSLAKEYLAAVVYLRPKLLLSRSEERLFSRIAPLEGGSLVKRLTGLCDYSKSGFRCQVTQVYDLVYR